MIDTCYGLVSQTVFDRLKNIKLLMLDVDGTLTDGGIYLNNEQGEYKRFYTKDGLGLTQLQSHSDCVCAVITGRQSHLVERRCEETHIQHVIQGQRDKSPAVIELLKKLGLSKEQSAAIGDDHNDLPMFKEAGFTACPMDATPYIQKICDITLHRNGGFGAVRELCDLILMAKGIMRTDGGFC